MSISFFQVPYEILNKKFRSAQKNIDREVSHVQNACSELEQCIHGGSATVEEVSKALSGVVEKLGILKRKVRTYLIYFNIRLKVCHYLV